MSRGLRVADLVRNEFYLKGPIPYEILVEVCFAKDAFVKQEKIHGAQGRILFSKNSSASIITINSEIKFESKKKFVLAHELGHRLLHYRKMNFLCNDKDVSSWSSNNKFEFEANEFAAELLMPQRLILEITDTKIFSKQEVLKISKNLGSSITSSSIQYSKYGHVPVYVIASSNGSIDWFSKPSDFYLGHFEKGQSLPRGSFANKFFDDGKKENDKSICLAKDWFPDAKQDQYLYEECFYFENYNSVITFLWICNEY
ncbi:MAG: ImmA/IrrE family metallo-endopeptidase [Balneolaceae bacterium]|nr:ImmA/IrrE family metallo-endopeptidase [Balneolaceae bacterium]